MNSNDWRGMLAVECICPSDAAPVTIVSALVYIASLSKCYLLQRLGARGGGGGGGTATCISDLGQAQMSCMATFCTLHRPSRRHE